MFGIAAFGSEDFVLGFQLAGIRDIVVADKAPALQIKELMKSHDTGVVIVEADALNRLDDYTKGKVRDFVRPVFVSVSEKAEDEGLRRMIKKSMGVDLWEK